MLFAKPVGIGFLVQAAILHVRATVAEAAGIPVLLHIPAGFDLDLLRPLLLGGGNGDAIDQKPCIRVRGMPDDQFGIARLHHMSLVHDDDIVADLKGGGQVVGDVKLGNIVFLFQSHHHVQHGNAQRRIDHGDRFVRNQESRRQQQRAGNHKPLQLAPAHLVGKFAQHVRGIQFDLHELLLDQPNPLRLGARHVKVPEHLLKHMIDRIERVVGIEGILEDSLYLRTIFGIGAALQGRNVLPPVKELPGRGLSEIQNEVGKGAFAAAALADNGERRCRGSGHGQRYAAHGNGLLLLGAKDFGQIAEF